MKAKQAIIGVGKRAWSRGWCADNSGNYSVRLSRQRFLVTRTGVSKGLMRAADIVACDMRAKKVAGRFAPSAEAVMHAAIYVARPDVKAIFHEHPPFATGFALAGKGLEKPSWPELVLNLGAVPCLPYRKPLSPELMRQVGKAIRKHDALLLGNHGAVTVAADINKAYYRMELVEQAARITLVARLLGGEKVLSARQVRELGKAAKRSKYGG